MKQVLFNTGFILGLSCYTVKLVICIKGLPVMKFKGDRVLGFKILLHISFNPCKLCILLMGYR